MRWLYAGLFVGLAVLLGGRLGEAGPIPGNAALKPRVGAKAEITLDKNTKSLGEHTQFKGGQRACVIVMGDHKPVVPVILEIRDEKGNLVGRDTPAAGVSDPKAKGNDVCAVIWYPPRDGYYRITVKNLGQEYNDCWIAIK
jgi:hypothetical protein